MKWNRKSFGIKLWSYFVLFAAIIFIALWLLQTVFLQSFYNGMVIRNVEKAAAQIAAGYGGEDFDRKLDSLAYQYSLLIFITDPAGSVFYSTDEHSEVYKKEKGQYENLHTSESKTDNPYRSPGELMNWQIGASRNLSLPQDYDSFLQKLSESKEGAIGYLLNHGSAYVYGMNFSSESGETVLYISTPLDAMGAAVKILRTQLIWVTVASLSLSFFLAYLIARRFSRPFSTLSSQAKQMAEGNFDGVFETGFCTELDELSDTLRQTADKLVKTENFRREFLANVSHDLRTPLTMIRGYAEMVQDFSWDDEGQREADLSVIIREAGRLTSLVNDIIEYTSLQSKPKMMDCEDFDLGAAAQEVIMQFEPLCLRSGFCIEARIDTHMLVNGSQKQMSRVLYNLIDNAVSHAGDKKKIQVLVKKIDKRVQVEVHDFGNGISPDDLPYIWERYFTLKQRKRNEKGSGLGLAISKEILLAHKAKFGVDSQEGEGCTFWFELPVAGET